MTNQNERSMAVSGRDRGAALAEAERMVSSWTVSGELVLAAATVWPRFRGATTECRGSKSEEAVI